MGCATGLVKLIVFIFNFTFVLAGLVYIANGVFLMKYYNVHSIDHAVQLIPSIYITVGGIIFFIAFLGCCGTMKNDTCILSSYAAILTILLAIQVGIGIFIMTQVKNRGELDDIVINIMNKVFVKYDSDPASHVFIDETQLSLSCCGIKGPSDYFPKISIPPSCCGKTDGVCTVLNGGFKDGCAYKLTEVVLSYSEIIGYLIMIVCCTELIGSILVFYLVGSINSERRRMHYAYA